MSRWASSYASRIGQAIGVQQNPWIKDLGVLAGIWLLVAVGDRLWLALDHSVPSWDPANHLNTTLEYWQALQQPAWFSGEWWTHFWEISPKYPPLTYIVTVPFLNLFGAGFDQATLVNLLFNAILIGAVYGLGRCLFTRQTGLLAAGICMLMPILYVLRLNYMTDYPLAAMVTLSFYCLTVWRSLFLGDRPFYGTLLMEATEKPDLPRWLQEWGWALVFGVAFGFTLLVKQTVLLMLFVPLAWVSLGSLRQWAWKRLLQLVAAFCLSILIMLPWVRPNWLLILTSTQGSTIDPALAEGDPPLSSPEAWLYYLRHLPMAASWLLVLVPLVCFLLYWRRSIVSRHWAKTTGALFNTSPDRQRAFAASQRSLLWLGGFLLAAYLLNSLNVNKDLRYAAAFLPTLAIFLAYGLTLLPNRWAALRWGTLGLSVVLSGLSLFPVLPGLVARFPDAIEHYPYLGAEYPHQQVIAEITRTDPYLVSVVGTVASTAELNEHTFSVYGNLDNFRVKAQDVAARQKYVDLEARSLSWFISWLDPQNTLRRQESKAALLQLLEQGEDFKLQKAWNLPDGTLLNLYRRRIPFLEVHPLDAPRISPKSPAAPVQLTQVLVPERVPPGKPIPVTYKWSGSWDALKSGLLLLTWQRQPSREEPSTKLPTKQHQWFHDHGLGLGKLHATAKHPSHQNFQVVERIAMLPPANAAAGTYRLQAIYMNRTTGETTTISVPTVELKLDAAASQVSNTLLVDPVSQLRSLASMLPKGLSVFTDLFNQVDRLNRFNPDQDYLNQAKQAVTYRLQQQPNNLELAYTLTLAHILKREVDPAIAALQQVIKLTPSNSYAHGYLAFVNLYAFRPQAAQAAIADALNLNSKVPEFHALKGVAALMQFKAGEAWQEIRQYQILAKKK